MNKLGQRKLSVLHFPFRFSGFPGYFQFSVLLFSLYLSSLTFTSCNPRKKIMKVPIREEGADYLIKKLDDHELLFEWFSAKFSADYENEGQKNSFSGLIRIRKDSLIWLTFSPAFGIEVIRMEITQDSVKFINRLNHTYFMGDYDYVNNFLHSNIDFDILQSFLIGNDLSLYENTSFKASVDNGDYKLATAERRKLKKFVRNSQEKLRILIQNLWIDPLTFKIIKANVKEIQKPNMKLEANYSDFEDVGNQLFPKKCSFDITAVNDIRVAVSFSKISLEGRQIVTFKIPPGYKHIK
jgi:hypothetical protein